MGAAATYSWNSQLDGILLANQDSEAPVIVASTLPDLLPEDLVDKCLQRGVPAVWGLTTGIKVADAMRRPFGDPARLRSMGAIAGSAEPGEWLAEHAAKSLLKDAGVSVPVGGLATGHDELAALVAQLHGPLALKISSPNLQHKSDIGALELGVTEVTGALQAFDRLRSIEGHEASPVLVEQMAERGIELLIAARRDSVVPCLVVGLGGVWVEMVGDATVIPLPTDVGRVTEALHSLRGASLLTGGRGRPPVDFEALAQLAVRVGELLIDEKLMLIELNPVFAYPKADDDGATAGAMAVDAVIRRTV
jgi:hypothetical protein